MACHSEQATSTWDEDDNSFAGKGKSSGKA
jgi:hypothetical protein